jgi:hypothetical protein
MIIVPLKATPNQTMQILLGGQSCVLNIYQTDYGLFMDVFVNNANIVYGVICQNLNRIVRSLYLGFVGDFAFQDTQGTSDPVYTGLGSRYQLIYLEADLPSGEG